MTEEQVMDEFEFKIGLLKEDDMDGNGAEHPPKVDLIGHHLKAILDIVELMKDGKEVVIDGFRFVGEETVYPLDG
jgi:hypothetical protein